MFGFFKNFKNDVTKAFALVHDRLVVLENKVDTLFGDKADASNAASEPEPPIEPVQTEAVAVTEETNNAA